MKHMVRYERGLYLIYDEGKKEGAVMQSDFWVESCFGLLSTSLAYTRAYGGFKSCVQCHAQMKNSLKNIVVVLLPHSKGRCGGLAPESPKMD